MDIGPLKHAERPWILARSAETGWEQLTAGQQAETTRDQVAKKVRAMLQHALQLPGSTVLVARDAGEPVGYMVVTVAPDELTGKRYGLFLDIWVEPQWRGRGLSSRLTAAGEAHCRARGLTRVRRIIAAHNEKSLRHALGDGCRMERYILEKDL